MQFRESFRFPGFGKIAKQSGVPNLQFGTPDNLFLKAYRPLLSG
ncbi:Uncharacterized protein dnm_066320 [Desulfonema magnum]|uniref:Uncharacterized protein n=1 Tax=Desulfonema magnum TaxID=45655 RepID=A0A975BSE5_9BACT|nr:Uncharacterized protein dnm_066320 [Desulfonema magnum]